MSSLEDMPPLWRAILVLEFSSGHPDAPLEVDPSWEPNATQREEIIDGFHKAREALEALWNEKRKQALKFPQNTHLLGLADKLDSQFKAWFQWQNRALAAYNYSTNSNVPLWVSGDKPDQQSPSEMDVRHFEEYLAQAVEQRNPVVEAATTVSVLAPAVADGYSVAAVREMTGLSNSTLNTYAKKAGVQTPGRGKRNFRYSSDDVRKMLETIIQKSTSKEDREKCRAALVSLPSTNGNPEITIKSHNRNQIAAR